ncbi:MAG: cobalamin biosynthesis protein [Methanoregula sp. PtaU1.Bin051]|nr:MAG: cobalamin biosynthesis protein [Methanoregula sp. PtaU1.Bin051]
MVPAGLAPVTPALVLAAALVIDRLIGDPRSPFHPVALLGRFIGYWGRPSCIPPYLQRAAGVLFWLITVIIFTLPFMVLSSLVPWYLYLLCAPFLLKICFAWRSLEEHANAVIDAVNRGLEPGREIVKMLVSRNTAALDEEQTLSAAYESLTENLTDSIVSPLLFYGVFGLPGSALFRAANTMDAMLGYRDERERLGWCAARMDDILNYIPARVTALFLLTYFAARGRFSSAWSIMRRDGKKRPGFNGGVVMAVMAGGAGIRFDKPGVYRIGDPERTLREGGPVIFRAVRCVALTASVLAAILACTTLFLLGSWINNIGIW